MIREKLLLILLVVGLVTKTFAQTGLEFHAQDDIGHPVPSWILVGEVNNQSRVGQTDDEGRYIFDVPDLCPFGQPVSAKPRVSVALYMPQSTKGYCQISAHPARLILTRKRLMVNAAMNYLVAIRDEEWAIAAHAGNEVWALASRHNEPLDTTFVRGIYAATARSLNIDLQGVVFEDMQQGLPVISPAFAAEVSAARTARKLSPGINIDVSLLSRLSGQTSNRLLYSSPSGDLEETFEAALRSVAQPVELHDVRVSVEAMSELIKSYSSLDVEPAP